MTMNLEQDVVARAEEQQSAVRSYYGETLQSSRDLRTTACCSLEAMPEKLRSILAQLHPEVRERFYGCGSPLPPAVEGATVLDLGCGSGRDVYLLSKLVGEQGRVIGVDMTEQQLAVAERHRAWHAQAFGHAHSNVTLQLGDLADLAALGIADGSVDVVVSNCVLNLVPDKRRASAGICRVLKPGGELYFSDVFSDRRLPGELLADPVLLGECLAGALYVEDFRRLLGELGMADARVCAQPDRADRCGDRTTYRLCELRVDHLARIQAAAGGSLRGLRPGRDLPGQLARAPAPLRAGRPSPVRERPPGAGLRKHRRHALGQPLCRAFPHRRRQAAAFRPVRLRARRIDRHRGQLFVRLLLT
ncbi:methyltransferase domain-containing protein [Rhodanobacter sp. OR444]|nr:methyltransferase domain-containing protein [Rhodanobacter sp. OR444]